MAGNRISSSGSSFFKSMDITQLDENALQRLSKDVEKLKTLHQAYLEEKAFYLKLQKTFSDFKHEVEQQISHYKELKKQYPIDPKIKEYLAISEKNRDENAFELQKVNDRLEKIRITLQRIEHRLGYDQPAQRQSASPAA